MNHDGVVSLLKPGLDSFEEKVKREAEQFQERMITMLEEHHSHQKQILEDFAREENARAKLELDELIRSLRANPQPSAKERIRRAEREYQRLVMDNRTLVNGYHAKEPLSSEELRPV